MSPVISDIYLPQFLCLPSKKVKVIILVCFTGKTGRQEHQLFFLATDLHRLFF